MICSSVCRGSLHGSDRYASFEADPQPSSGLIIGESSQRFEGLVHLSSFKAPDIDTVRSTMSPGQTAVPSVSPTALHACCCSARIIAPLPRVRCCCML